MNWLVTYPGRMGDLLWMLPTIRAFAAKFPGGKFDLLTSPHCSALSPLLRAQPYIGDVMIQPGWDDISSQSTRMPSPVPDGHQKVYHLGMRRWPTEGLFRYHARLLAEDYQEYVNPNPGEPWLRVDGGEWVKRRQEYVAVSFNDGFHEFKAKFLWELSRALHPMPVVVLNCAGSRMGEYAFNADNVEMVNCWVMEMAQVISRARFLVAGKSMPFVTACGLGVPVAVVEPENGRHGSYADLPYPRNITYEGMDDKAAVACCLQMLDRTGGR